MKTRIVLLLLLAGLMTMGSQCINDSFIVAINLDAIGNCYQITVNAPTSTYAPQPVTIDPASLLDQSYADKIKNARLVDITLGVTGYTGTADGDVFFNGTTIFHYHGDFSTPRSLLRDRAYFSNLNVTPLVNILTTRPLRFLALRTAAILGSVGLSLRLIRH